MSKITIGMATYNDFEGVWCTVQSIFLHNNWNDPSDVEVVIVDTSPPGSDHKRLVQDLCKKHPIKYVELTENIGTTYPRDLIFSIATTPYVIVCDCHVMFPTNVLKQMLDWFEAHPKCDDLIHGPMVYDDLNGHATHMADQFRGGMWGTWSNIWSTPEGTLFSVEGQEVTDEDRQRESYPNASFRDVMTLKEIELNLPIIPFAGHQKVLKEIGCIDIGSLDTDTPYEIPGMGMGCFASRRESWLGFAKNCTGFGGEEMNIHTKYRQAGRKAVCLPFFKWNHRFGRAGGAPYPLPHAAKVRNYVLWANELGIPLDRIRTHFVAGGGFALEQWNRLVRDPMSYHIPMTLPPQGIKALDALFAEVASRPRDLNQHAEYIRGLAGSVQSVRAFVKRVEWETILAAGFPNKLDVYQTEKGTLTQQTHDAAKAQSVKDSRKLASYNTHNGLVDPLEIEPEETELLVIDQIMRGDYLSAVLNKHGHYSSKYILIRGTAAFGDKAEFAPDSPGLFSAIKEWIETNPDWFVAEHKTNQYGMTLLGREPLTPPSQEIRPWPIGYGPGTELKAILASIGINPSVHCSCNARMRQMDEWGIEGCEEHFDTIIGWLEEKAAEWGWVKAAEAAAPNENTLSVTDKLAIGWKSLMTGLAFKIDWSNPYPGLVREAIKRAQK